MPDLSSEKLIARILSAGAAFTTIFIVSDSVTDPVNAPKLVVLGITGASALGILFFVGVISATKASKLPILLCCLFMLAMGVSTFSSDSPLSQNLYGSYGRNNGLITYLFLVAILMSSLALRTPASFEYIVKALLFAGLINIAYCLWVILFGDFIGWSNPYGNILGTLGNPNFIGAFLGIFFTAYFAYSLSKSASKLFKYSSFVVLPITALEIYESHAIQGRVVAALGIGIVGFLLIRSRYGSVATLVYAAFGLISGILGLLGALQIGPLTKYIYKTSVSLRGQYWLAAWNTGDSHPLAGVGMDSFGDWYRRSRDIHAIELPGVNTVVNAAHNVPLDMFAFGGWPLLLTYLAIMGLAGMAAVRLIIRKTDFDPILAVLVASWSGYQLQSIISINQIGLAIWGWLLSGALIAYEKASRITVDHVRENSRKTTNLRNTNGQASLRVLVGTFTGLIGLIIALPPFASDAKWRSAQLGRTLVALEASMQPSLFNIQNSTKYLSNIQTIEESQLFEISHKYALDAVKWNPEAFELWKVLYLLKNSTPAERDLALQNMKRLDPLNPDVTAIR